MVARPGLTRIAFTNDRTGFGDLADPQELTHLLGEGGDGLGAVQHHAPLGEHGARLVRRDLEPLLTFAVLLDAVSVAPV